MAGKRPPPGAQALPGLGQAATQRAGLQKAAARMISKGNPKVRKLLRQVYEKYNPEKADDANLDKIMKHFHGGAPGLTYTDLFAKLWKKYDIAGEAPQFAVNEGFGGGRERGAAGL